MFNEIASKTAPKKAKNQQQKTPQTYAVFIFYII